MVHPAIKRPTKAPLLQRLWKARWFNLLMAPGLIYFFVCNYITMAFQEYSPSLGFLKSPWAGLKHFQQFFHDGSFEKLFGNTLDSIAGELDLFLPRACHAGTVPS